MTGVFEYFPRLEYKKNFKNIAKKFSHETKSFIACLLRTISPFAFSLEPAHQKLENVTGELNDDHQVERCLEIFENSIKRREKLESKSEKLMNIVLIFIPVISASMAYLFSDNKLSGYLRVFVVIMLGVSILFILLTFLASFRAKKIRNIEEPFVEAIIDVSNNKFHEYEQKKEGLLYLYCGINNQVLNDHIANFVRASEYFIISSVISILLTVSPILYTKIFYEAKTSNQTQVVKRIDELNKNLNNINLTLQNSIQKDNASKRIHYKLEKTINKNSELKLSELKKIQRLLNTQTSILQRQNLLIKRNFSKSTW